MEAPTGPKWSNLLRDMLSQRAIDSLDAADLRRDPTLACDRQRLRGILRERRLPEHQAILEYEERIGSVIETIALFDQCVRQRAPLTAEGLQRYDNRALLPIGYWSDPYHKEESDEDLYDYLMDEGGTCYFMDRGDGDLWPISESYQALIERHAFGLEFYRTANPRKRSSQWKHELHVHRQDLAIAIASELGIPAFRPATDRHGGIWANSKLSIQCYAHPNTARIFATQFEDAVRALEAAYAIQPKAIVIWWWHDTGAPLQPDEPIAYRLPAYGYGGNQDGEFLVIGTPGRYRLHRTKGPR